MAPGEAQPKQPYTEHRQTDRFRRPHKTLLQGLVKSERPTSSDRWDR